MSLENISSFDLKSIKKELEIKNKVPKYKSNYTYLKKNQFRKKINPKFKLPPISQVISDIINDEEVPIDDELKEIKNKISSLKKAFDEDPSEEIESVNLSFDVSARTNVDDTKSDISEISIVSVVDDIIFLENKLKQSILELQQVRHERLKEQNEICKKLQTLNKCPFEKKNTQTFFKICDYRDTNTKSISKPRFVAKKVKTIKSARQKLQDKSKNIQLSKNTNMSTLTDEEKARIQELLADMDENGEDIKKPGLEESHLEGFSNAFSFGDAEKNVINEIQEKLNDFEDTEEKRNLLSQFDEQSYDQIDWKEIKNLSMKEIDKALETLRTSDKSTSVEKIDKLEETT